MSVDPSHGRNVERAKPPGASILGFYVGDLNDARRHIKAWLGWGDPFGVAHFESVYETADPWSCSHCSYELLKRQVAEFTLGEGQFGRALDIGSGEAHLATHLRAHFEAIDLLDASAQALKRARERVNAPGDNLTGNLKELLAGLPPKTYGLGLLSEVLYYLAPVPWGPLDRYVRTAVANALRPGGRLLLVHPLAFLYHQTWRRDRRFRVLRRVTLLTGRKVEVIALERIG